MRARPNPAHTALAQLETLGALSAVITQNIDNLHQEAGSREVIEFHGNAASFICLACGANYRHADLTRAPGELPRCPADGRPLKPDVVLFGEGIPSAALTASFERASRCDVLLIVGTSAEVSPANQIPYLARRVGATLAEFNLTDTMISGICDYHFQGKASATLAALVDRVRALKETV